MLPYFYDPPYNMAARPVPKAAHGCPHKQLGAAGDIETKRAAKAGYAPAMYHMHTSYAAKAAQIAAERPRRHGTPRTQRHGRDNTERSQTTKSPI
jgi:hypothetical protein